MITRDARALLARCNPHVARNLEAAAGFTITRTHYEVTVEHLFLKFLEDAKGDLPKILRYFEVDPGLLEGRLLAAVEQFRAGNSGRPSFSPLLFDSLEKAFLVGALGRSLYGRRAGWLSALVFITCLLTVLLIAMYWGFTSWPGTGAYALVGIPAADAIFYTLHTVVLLVILRRSSAGISSHFLG